MKRIIITAGAALLAMLPAAMGFIGNTSFSESLPVRVPSQAVVVDDHGGQRNHVQVGDDKGGPGKHSKAGDDKGGQRKQVQAGDDKGGQRQRAEAGDGKRGLRSGDEALSTPEH